MSEPVPTPRTPRLADAQPKKLNPKKMVFGSLEKGFSHTPEAGAFAEIAKNAEKLGPSVDDELRAVASAALARAETYRTELQVAPERQANIEQRTLTETNAEVMARIMERRGRTIQRLQESERSAIDIMQGMNAISRGEAPPPGYVEAANMLENRAAEVLDRMYPTRIEEPRRYQHAKDKLKEITDLKQRIAEAQAKSQGR